jgi:hypothetical protein
VAGDKLPHLINNTQRKHMGRNRRQGKRLFKKSNNNIIEDLVESEGNISQIAI